MKTLDRLKLDSINKTHRNLFDRCGQFTPDSNPIEFEGFGNCGEFAAIRNRATSRLNSGSNSVEFDGIKNSGKLRFTRSTV